MFGNQGEAIAEAFLRKKGYEILARQFRVRAGEIDLVAQEGDEVVFVEVKTRRSLAAGHPEESVHMGKLHRMALAAEAFLTQKKWEAKPYRFDVIAITVQNGIEEIRHIVGV